MPLASADVPGRGRLCGEPNKSLHRRQDDKGSGCNNDNAEVGDDTEEHMEGREGGMGRKRKGRNGLKLRIVMTDSINADDHQ